MSKVDRFECPGCGNSDVKYDIEKQKLVCQYCKMEIEENNSELLNNISNIQNIKGNINYSGSNKIDKNSDDVITIVCDGCGAEVVIDTTSKAYAKCHWCRSVLSLNSKIDNGSMPDVVLPFSITKEQTLERMNKFVSKRKFFALNKFKNEFNGDNIMGVYFPYMIIDANVHANFMGFGEKEIKVINSDKRKNEIIVKSYGISREFDLTVDDLTIESSMDRIDKKRSDKTNNIINSIMPFDTENCIPYKGNYLVGYTSEKRDLEINELEKKVDTQIKTLARLAAKKTITEYDRGVRWNYQKVETKGKKWISAYLPVWIYSYQEVNKNESKIHYIAVNGRTGETMGSVPMNLKKLLIVSAILETILYIISSILYLSSDGDIFYYLICVIGILFFIIKYNKYRNKSARHSFEKETKYVMYNLQRKDEFIDTFSKNGFSTIMGKNDGDIEE